MPGDASGRLRCRQDYADGGLGLATGTRFVHHHHLAALADEPVDVEAGLGFTGGEFLAKNGFHILAQGLALIEEDREFFASSLLI